MDCSIAVGISKLTKPSEQKIQPRRTRLCLIRGHHLQRRVVKRLVGASLVVAVGDVVSGRSFVVGPERVLQVFIVGDVLDLVEIVPKPLLLRAVVDEVGSASIAIRAESVDQVAVGCDVLQAIEGTDALLVETVVR